MIVRSLSTPQNDPFFNSLVDGLLHATQQSALAAYNWIGKGEEKAADQAAVSAMRAALNQMPISGYVAIGEGERDQAPMLYIGEQVGMGGIDLDIALDPLEGTTLCAHNAPNSIAVLAAAERGNFLHAPDIYMKKIAFGAGIPANAIDLSAPIADNLKLIAKCKDKKPEQLVICVLNRPRHEQLIKEIRAFGAKIRLIKDGDVLAALATCLPDSEIDVYAGIGGAPEGVLAAAALKSLGGDMQGQLLFSNEIEKQRALEMGIKELDAIYNSNEMAKGEVVFCATGVTSGEYLTGVKKESNVCSTSSLLIQSHTSSLKVISEQIFFNCKR